MTYAWTPGAGAYKHYPPYVNLTGNRLTVRGAEGLSGEHPQPGPTVSIDLPADQLALLCAEASQLSGVVGERDAQGHIDALANIHPPEDCKGPDCGVCGALIHLETYFEQRSAALNNTGGQSDG